MLQEEDSDPEQRQGRTHRKDSSGDFEVIEALTCDVPPVTHISTIRNNIIINSTNIPKKILTTEEWQHLLVDTCSNQNIFNYINIVYSICQGLPSLQKQYFWERMCQEDSLPSLKQSSSHNQQYDKQIKESVSKLRDRLNVLSGQQFDTLEDRACSVLIGYYCSDPEVGFCKSMEYLALALVCTLSNPSDISSQLMLNSCNYFTFILRRKKLRDMFFPGYPGLFSKVKELEQMVREELPTVYLRINKLGIEWQNIFFKHYLTVFIHKLPFKCLLNCIMQMLVLQGHMFITHVLKRILEQTAGKLVQMNNEVLEEHLKNNIFYQYFTAHKEEEVGQVLLDLMVKVQQVIK